MAAVSRGVEQGSACARDMGILIGVSQIRLARHLKLIAAFIPADKRLYEQQVEVTDRQSDTLVYEWYGLTEEKIRIVRKGVNLGEKTQATPESHL